VPTSIDVTFSNGGLIGSGGHPTDIASRNIARGSWTPADGEGGFYHTIDTLADLDKKWPLILAERPDFIKTYLLYSEEYEKRRDDPAYGVWKGLSPQILAEITRQAHAAGLRVATHVETAADFRNALAAGVDEINHLPGFRPDRGKLTNYSNPAVYRLTEEDARSAAKKDVIVVTTISGVLKKLTEAKPGTAEATLALAAKKLVADNISILRRHGVPVVIGSDEYRETSAIEAKSLAHLGVLDNLSLLKMWSEATPRAIFPRRKLGKLMHGYEASFLVLAGNPLKDFTATESILMRVKQGHLLPPPAQLTP
jgi:imidazolonepropionase-like amidohydrolase